MGLMLHSVLAAIVALLATASAYAGEPKSGGILKMYHRETPGGISIHEEATFSTNTPLMPIFNNLVIYDQHKAQNSLDTIVPELATSWAWSEDKTKLTFKLRDGVKWHDGKPFTAKDVKCTWDMLMGKCGSQIPQEPAQGLVPERHGGHGRTATPRRPSISSGRSRRCWRCSPPAIRRFTRATSPPAQMRTQPIGTGPFKFVELKQNEVIRLTKNADYWRKGMPYLDGIEFPIIPNRSTAILAFLGGKFDATFPTEVSVPLLKDVKAQAPQALRPGADQRHHQPDRQPRDRAIRQCGA